MPDEQPPSAPDAPIRVTVLPSDLIELYKHHFDLFLKGYGLQLAVIAALAGFALDDGPTPLQRRLLLGYGAAVCLFCAGAWYLGMRWRSQFVAVLGSRCGDPELGSAITHLSKLVLPLALATSLATAI